MKLMLPFKSSIGNQTFDGADDDDAAGVMIPLSHLCFAGDSINVIWLFLAVPWVGLQYVIVVFPDHTHFLVSKF